MMESEVRVSTGFHDGGNAYANVEVGKAMSAAEVKCMNVCARQCGRAFAAMLTALQYNGRAWVAYDDEVQWYGVDGEEVVDDDDFAEVRTVQCMVCAEDE